MQQAAAITHQDNLEFLDDTIPKTQPYREVKQKAAETRAKLSSTTTGYPAPEPTSGPNANRKRPKKQKESSSDAVVEAPLHPPPQPDKDMSADLERPHTDNAEYWVPERQPHP